jgi:hypothetical protein
MTERREVVIRLSPPGRGASSQPDRADTADVSARADHGEVVA